MCIAGLLDICPAVSYKTERNYYDSHTDTDPEVKKKSFLVVQDTCKTQASLAVQNGRWHMSNPHHLQFHGNG